jgi:hypothetical protein
MQKKITVYGRLFEGFPSHCSRLKISHVKASEMVIMRNLNVIISWISYFLQEVFFEFSHCLYKLPKGSQTLLSQPSLVLKAGMGGPA